MANLQEVWLPIKDYPNYQISNLGKIRNLKRDKFLNFGFHNKGYLLATLWKNNNQKTYTVHRLVAETFIPNINDNPQINHKNSIKTDNRVENLEWCTCK